MRHFHESMRLIFRLQSFAQQEMRTMPIGPFAYKKQQQNYRNSLAAATYDESLLCNRL